MKVIKYRGFYFWLVACSLTEQSCLIVDRSSLCCWGPLHDNRPSASPGLHCLPPSASSVGTRSHASSTRGRTHTLVSHSFWLPSDFKLCLYWKDILFSTFLSGSGEASLRGYILTIQCWRIFPLKSLSWVKMKSMKVFVTKILKAVVQACSTRSLLWLVFMKSMYACALFQLFISGLWLPCVPRWQWQMNTNVLGEMPEWWWLVDWCRSSRQSAGQTVVTWPVVTCPSV